MDSIGVYEAVKRFVAPGALPEFGDALLAKGRADNAIRKATVADAQEILRNALQESRPLEPHPVIPGRVIWVTGLSGAGKTTLGRAIAAALRASGRKTVLLDGDEVRAVIGRNLGHTDRERRELASSYSALCRLLSTQGIDVVCATISMFHDCRQWNRRNIPNYLEVYIKSGLPALVSRDPKGLYARALRGEANNVVGIDLPFEEPSAPDLVLVNDGDLPAFLAKVSHVVALVKPGAPIPIEECP
jgi:adenylylsulfate kinase